MTFYVSENFVFSPPVMALSDEVKNPACGLWVLAGSWSSGQKLNGYVTEDVLLGFIDNQQAISALVGVGLFSADLRGGYWLGHGHGSRQRLWKMDRSDYRKKISNSLRHRVYDRDGWQCLRCGAVSNLSLDHIQPWILGGDDTYENLQTLCRPCNSSKGASV